MKLKQLVKELNPGISLIKILMALVSCAALVLPGIQYIVRQEMAPVVSYIHSDIEKLIVKNAAKIVKDPGDVKIEDIETALNYWPMLQNSDIVNKASLLEKVEILRGWYRENTS